MKLIEDKELIEELESYRDEYKYATEGYDLGKLDAYNIAIDTVKEYTTNASEDPDIYRVAWNKLMKEINEIRKRYEFSENPTDEIFFICYSSMLLIMNNIDNDISKKEKDND